MAEGNAETWADTEGNAETWADTEGNAETGADTEAAMRISLFFCVEHLGKPSQRYTHRTGAHNDGQQPVQHTENNHSEV